MIFMHTQSQGTRVGSQLVEGLDISLPRRLPSAAEIFDAFAYPGREPMRNHLERYLRVVALPRAYLVVKLHPGDCIVRRAEGGLGHLSVIASPKRWRHTELASAGLMPESYRAGEYVQVVEGSARPQSFAEGFARRLTETDGRLPYDQLVLCPHEHARGRVRGTGNAGEAFPESLSDFLGLLNPQVINQWMDRLTQGIFDLSLLARFGSGEIWNEDYLALEILFHREPNLRPADLDTLSGSRRLRRLYELAVRYQTQLRPIREQIVRPLFGNPANFQIGPSGECTIQDLRAQVRTLGPLPAGTYHGHVYYKRDAGASPRRQTAIDSIVLHHMAFNRGNDVNSYKEVGAHYAVLADGQIAQLYDDLDFMNASNGFNARSIAIEFAGNFPAVNYQWWQAQGRSIPDRCYLTPAQIRAGRCLVGTLKNRFPGIAYIYAHRQSSTDRTGDPGPDVWFNVGEWAHTNLSLTDRQPQTHIGTGNPIPDAWRASRPVVTSSATPAREMAGPPREMMEAVERPCPDVPVSPSARPRVLVLDSVHSAVREAQRKLNAFHRYCLAAGLPGLRDAPLAEDCIVGTHTFNAVKSFQELVFPGLTKEHDGKIGPHTWAQLDAIAVGPGPTPAAQLTIAMLRITDDSFTGLLSWDQVIGLDTTTLNVEIVATGLPPATMPAQIRVELVSRVANRAGGSATLGTPVNLDVPRFGPDPADPNRIVYRINRPLPAIGDFLKVERQIKEMATIVRNGGTSDGEFRSALGWNLRGMATQPITAGASTGSEAGEIPDAFALFRSAGVEVLVVSVPAQPNWNLPGAVTRLVRSPADVVYYSGHGLSASGKLAIDIENKPCGEHGTYSNWLGASDLIPVWKSPMDLDVLILAGCSVLKIDFSTSPASGPGVEWSKLLVAKGGPLAALLGYQKAAPCDSPNGDRIAKAMGARMAKGSTNFARDWLEVNGDNNANNAVAMDARGYWWIEGTLLGGYDIKGPKPIP